MAISRTVKRFLDNGDYDALEDDWLQHAAETPEDVDYFVGVLRALVGVGEVDRTRLLFELIDGQLEERELWSVRLRLLRRLPEQAFQPSWMHPEILSTLKRLYGGSSLCEPLIEKVGLHRAIDDLPKTWEKVDRFLGLAVFEIGSIVLMEGKGVGRVVEANLELESFRVDLEGIGGLSVGFRAAAKLLTPLPAGHFLRRKVEDPEALREATRQQPGEVLGQLLKSLGRDLTAGEIRQALAGLVGEAEWTSWWGAARKHPQVMTVAGKRQAYTWADSAAGALESVWSEFEKADHRDKLRIYRQSASREPALRQRMTASLVDLAQEALASDPVTALEIYYLLEKDRAAVDQLGWTPDDVAARSDRPLELVLGFEDRQLRERLLTGLRQTRSDWPALFTELIGRESEPRVLDLLADGLAAGDRLQLERFYSDVANRPRHRPAAFVWMAERAAGDDAALGTRPLRLLLHILHGLAWEELQPFRARLRKLFEPGGTVARLLPLLDEGDAVKAEQAILRTGSLEDYARQPLLNALHLRFPGMRQVEVPLYATAESIAARRGELKHLLEVDIPANRKAIEEARALGDLRENFEYKSARQRHEYLSARIVNLQRDLARSRPIDTSRAESEQVRIGCRVGLTGSGPRTLTILGPWESRPEEGIVSYESELGAALLGKELGDEVVIEGERFAITSIYPYS